MIKFQLLENIKRRLFPQPRFTKESLLSYLDYEFLGVTGRVQDWLSDPDSRYPVSCTVISVEDSMEGERGIEYSWLYVSKALRYAAGVSVDLSKLRPKGNINAKGLEASGVASFAKFYSLINEELRRGGIYKNGGVSVFLDIIHPDLNDFLTMPLGDWVKKAVYISDNPESDDYIFNHPELIEKILPYIQNGTLWVAKKRWYDPYLKMTVNYPPHKDIWKDRLFSNLCLEVLLRTNCTCLLSHLNLGKTTLGELSFNLCTVTEFLCKLHTLTGTGKNNYYVSPEQDKQIGVGLFGMANFLARYGITYKEFATALDLTIFNLPLDANIPVTAYRIAEKFVEAYQEASQVAKKYGMERAFVIAPTATVSYKNLDFSGYTTAPEISPPVAHPETKNTSRDSAVHGLVTYTYPPEVEVASEVEYADYFKLANALQNTMNIKGLAHSISFNTWNTQPITEEWFAAYVESDLLTLYYRLMVEQNYGDKSTVFNLPGDVQEDIVSDFFTPVEEAEPSGFCLINKPGCESCSE